jgi:signal transduction histidine kinase
VHQIAPLLEQIAAVSSKSLPLSETLTGLTEALALFIEVDGCTILRWDRDLDKIVVLADYVSPLVDTPFANVTHVGAAYPLDHFPATARILQEHAPLIVYAADPHTDEAEKNLLEAFQWTGVLIVPMLCQDQAIGLVKLAVAGPQARQFSPEEVAFCQTLANQIALAIQNRQLLAEAEEGPLHAEALQVIGRALAAELDHHRIVRDVADFAYRLVGAQFVCVATPDEEETFQVVATAGRSNKDESAIHSSDFPSWLIRHSPLAEAVAQKRPIIVDRVDDNPPLALWQEEALNRGWRALVAVPLLAHNRLVGVLAASAYYSNFFGPNEVAILMSLASQAAVAIQNARLFAQLEANRQELQEVSLRLVNAQEEERRRISRELHDELGQALTALKINLDVARRVLPENTPPKLRQSVREASSLAMQTLEAARSLSLELHPAILDDLGLVSALRWEIDRYEQRIGQSVNFSADVRENLALQPELEITIYRIITEALTNIARHAEASDIRVSLQVTDTQVELEVKDNGIGFDVENLLKSPAERQGLGLVSMRERAGLLAGELKVTSEPGQGTQVRAEFPIRH